VRQSEQPRSIERSYDSPFVVRVLASIGLLVLAGCGHLEPWVKPYERAALAEPIMEASRNPVADEYMFHVFEVREGARGASGSAGGGCGCN
jgi:hypothetical protein